ncbi:MAG: flagellar brake protein [Thermodesulfobacteriota bacterium]|nr:flagellar brake protein [Thermodesulfobacteriota bacterium]
MKNGISIESGTSLELTVEGTESSWRSILVGIRPNEYIVITPPPDFDSVKDKFFRGDKIVVNYLFRNKFCEFTTKFIEIASNPIELILLGYPESIRTCERRSHKRINCFVSAEVEIKDERGGGPTKGFIRDMSKTGCCFVFKASKTERLPFGLNEKVSLRCIFPGIPGGQEALGEVKSIQTEGEEMAVGIRFGTLMWWVPPYT